MAISPPSDIILDVARAVDPAALQAAKTALAERGGAATSTGPAGAFSLAEASEARATVARGAAPESEGASFKKFEAMVLQTFIQNMLPKEAESVYGSGISGDMWKSLTAGKIADVMAERGGIGIADRLLADHYVEGEKKLSIGPVSRGPERTELDMQTMLSTSLVQQLERMSYDSITDGDDRKAAADS